MLSRLSQEIMHGEPILIDSTDEEDQPPQRPHKRLKTNPRARSTALSDHRLHPLPGKESGSYITPDPSHHAAEHDKAADSNASAQDEVDGQLATELSHLGGRLHPSPSLLQLEIASERASGSSAVAPKTAVEATCSHNYGGLQRATAHAVCNELRQARLSARRQPTQHDAAASLAVLEGIKPLELSEQLITTKNRTNKHRSRDAVYLNIDTWSNAHTKRKKFKKRYEVPHSVAPTTSITQVPQYSHFVRLPDNLLAPNMKMLHTWPYHGDEWQPQLEDYKGYYAIDVDDRYDKLRRLQQGVWLFDFAEATVTDLGISWQDVLAFLFAPITEEGTGDAWADTLLRKRGTLVDPECPLASTAWIDFASSFPRDNHRFIRAACFCDFFQRETGVSAWHVVRRCAIVREHFSEDDAPLQDDEPAQDDECRVCHRFVCEIHGEICETDPNDDCEEPVDQASQDLEGADDADDDSESDLDSTEDTVARDIVNPQQNNFRKTVRFVASAKPLPNATDPRKSKSYWDSYLKPDDTLPHYPCSHPGVTCRDACCPCNKAGVPCSKYCACSPDCKRRFQGCSCSIRNRNKTGDHVCFRDERCACYMMGRECDPDLCGSCGVYHVLSHLDAVQGRCNNASLQRGVSKHTVLGRSHVHEYGLYACETIKPHDFIGEYKGEIITKEEANRRGAVYEHQKMSYLFSLNKHQEVDSTFFGNKIRFINHSSQDARNIYAVIMMVNTVHRIAMFADRRIEAGEELYFDYGPTFPTEQVGGKEVSKSVPKARNAKLVETFAAPQLDSQSEERPGRSRVSSNTSRQRAAFSPTRSGELDEYDDHDTDATDETGYNRSARDMLAGRHSMTEESDSSPQPARKRKRKIHG